MHALTIVTTLAIALLLTAAPTVADEEVRVPTEDGPCTAVKVYTSPPDLDVHPECIGNASASP